MDEPIIQVENLGKRYRIHHRQDRERYAALRDVLTEKVQAAASRIGSLAHRRPSANTRDSASEEDFWALRGVSFDVPRGEVLGVIGRNGAGKTTLLKILSRITEPSEGRVRLRGRVASLLEVGTGFHPELSGRENIFLNGAILGMSRAEVRARFDEIAAFAEVEKFLDTPVKRYSSGMYVRLAFAVAAHLDPDILIVDEVLAVGDAEFQKRSLGRMRTVSQSEGRTVLFVSHNMQAVQSLCANSILMIDGKLAHKGPTPTVVSHYLAHLGPSTGEKLWAVGEGPGDSELRLTALRVHAKGESSRAVLSSKGEILVDLEFLAETSNPGLCVGFDVDNASGGTVLRTFQTDQPVERWPTVERGLNRWQCVIPRGLLNAGVYSISPRVGIHNQRWLISIEQALEFEVVLDHGVSPLWNSLSAGSRPGSIAPVLSWQALNAASGGVFNEQ